MITSLVTLALLIAVPDDVPVDGDPALIDLVRMAQASNLSRFPRGEIDVERITRSFILISKNETVKRERILQKWSGDNSYWEFSDEQSGATIQTGSTSGRMVSDGAKFTLFLVSGHSPGNVVIATKSHFNGRTPLDLDVRPSVAWAHAVEKRLWSEMIGPHPNMPDAAKRWDVRESRSNVVVRRFDKQGDGVLTITASLRYSGHVIRSEYTSAMQDSQRDFEWQLDHEGRAVLRKEHTINEYTQPKMKSEVTIIVHSISTDVEFSADQFTEAALQIRSGAIVEDRLQNRRYTFAAKPVNQAILDQLARRLAGKGFAAARASSGDQ